jgi:hypothetical protein
MLSRDSNDLANILHNSKNVYLKLWAAKLLIKEATHISKDDLDIIIDLCETSITLKYHTTEFLYKNLHGMLLQRLPKTILNKNYRTLLTNLMKPKLADRPELEFEILTELYFETLDIDYLDDLRKSALRGLNSVKAQEAYEAYLIIHNVNDDQKIVEYVSFLMKHKMLDSLQEFETKITKLTDNKFALLYLKICIAFLVDPEKCHKEILKSNIFKQHRSSNFLIHDILVNYYKSVNNTAKIAYHTSHRNKQMKQYTTSKHEDLLSRVERMELFYKGTPSSNEIENHTILTGFPRSGTTLLENMLASHNFIETFEETNLYNKVISFIFDHGGNIEKSQLSQRVASLYTQGLDRMKMKESRFTIDKMPILTLYSKIINEINYNQKYIFCIRKPKDVILSCWFQTFTDNAAMNAFLEISSAVKFYDLCMRKWFSVHTLDDRNVHYLYYNELIDDEETTIRNLFHKLEIPWDKNVLNFQKNATLRSARTPSYEKVRMGNTIGIQTYNNDYDELFTSTELAVMHKWSEFLQVNY